LLNKKLNSKNFKNYLKKFEHLSKNAAELVKANQNNRGFSKFGGLPIVPDTFEWPVVEDEPKLFLAQFDFEELNADGNLKDFPTKGLLYLFADSEMDCSLNGCVFLYYETTKNLKPAVKPKNLSATYKEVYVTSKLINTYPSLDDCEEGFKIYEDAGQEDMDDLYGLMCKKNESRTFIGGWASYLDEANFMVDLDGANEWMLLCQVNGKYAHIKAKDVEQFTSWGDDDGVLYIYIRKDSLKKLDFSQTEIDIQYGFK